MPYVHCAGCNTRSFALAPWSKVDRCPVCETPLTVPGDVVAGAREQPRDDRSAPANHRTVARRSPRPRPEDQQTVIWLTHLLADQESTKPRSAGRGAADKP